MRIKYGRVIAIIFTCMLLSFVSSPSDSRQSTQKAQKLSFRNSQSSFHFKDQTATWHIEDSLAKYYDLTGSKDFSVYKTPLFDINLHVQYATEPESKTIVPVYAYTSIEGILAGITWEPHAPLVTIDDRGENMKYTATGTIKWKLMNMPISTSGKSFEGSVKLLE